MKPLTPRQTEITELLALGLAQKEVADHLDISVNTVDVLIRQAKERIGVTKTTELVAWYYIHKYQISLNLSPIKQALISASLLSLLVFTMITDSFNQKMIRPVRAQRAQRSTRTRSRRNEGDYEDAFLFDERLILAV